MLLSIPREDEQHANNKYQNRPSSTAFQYFALILRYLRSWSRNWHHTQGFQATEGFHILRQHASSHDCGRRPDGTQKEGGGPAGLAKPFLVARQQLPGLQTILSQVSYF